ncbi:hypothetical protein RvY_09755 [Ramazzottius varieornatus]|uniref:Serpin domain-containing protein n=1 Tax=Ramazzottius varieornatus TaxID=947166 RepID=A0A1D1VAH5_RAMVA|nr:hypothetical protein RvY_09755 [Ramazzottius varieornatus]
MEQLRSPLTSMCMRVFQAALQTSTEKNVVVCPFTITGCATMLYYASEGTFSTAHRQLEDSLMYSNLFDKRSDAKLVLLAFRQAIKVFTKHQLKEDDPAAITSPEFRLTLINRIFLPIATAEVLNPDFVEICEKNLKIDFEILDSSLNGRETENAIEQWLDDHQKVQQRFDVKIPRGLIDSTYNGHRLVFANAAHFRAGWEVPFDPRETKIAPFRLIGGKLKEVELMHLTDKFPYYEDPQLGLKTMELPYYHNICTLIITVCSKKDGFMQAMEKLSNDYFLEAHLKKRMKLIRVALPKFHVQSTYEMTPLLRRIGIKEVLQDDCVLENMSKTTPLRRTEGIHKCALMCDEEGTYVNEKSHLELLSGQYRKSWTPPVSHSGKSDTGDKKNQEKNRPPQAEEFVANSPFLVALRHNLTGVFLFAGCITEP